jgi:hypothetical protein
MRRRHIPRRHRRRRLRAHDRDALGRGRTRRGSRGGRRRTRLPPSWQPPSCQSGARRGQARPSCRCSCGCSRRRPARWTRPPSPSSRRRRVTSRVVPCFASPRTGLTLVGALYTLADGALTMKCVFCACTVEAVRHRTAAIAIRMRVMTVPPAASPGLHRGRSARVTIPSPGARPP